MKALELRNKLGALGFGQPAGDKVQVTLLVRAIDLVPHQRMTGPSQVNPDLMFATGLGVDLNQGE